MNIRWKLGIFAGIILVAFALCPQARMLYIRGEQWQGNYAILDGDEPAYTAYVQALIDGKPRKADPYTERQDSAVTPQYESLFSIQFAPPYAIAIPAKIFGVSAPVAITLAGFIAAFCAALAMFWLIAIITGNSWYAFAGSLLVLCFGAHATGWGVIFEFLGFDVPGVFFPVFRRYLPAIPFPVFFVFCGSIWLFLNEQGKRAQMIYALLAFLSFGFLVFSYLYLWTTAAAWLFSVAGLWCIFRPDGWKEDIKAYLPLCSLCLLWLIPYNTLLLQREPAIDTAQLLVLTHAPDFARFPEYIGLSALLILAVGMLSGLISPKHRPSLVGASFALVPLVVHNQQILTGRELQPVHYDFSIVNYVALLALVIVAWPFLERILSSDTTSIRYVAALVAAVSVGLGLIDCYFVVKRFDGMNIERDRGFAIAKHLREIAKTEGATGTVMSFNHWLGDDLPTLAPQPVLWEHHQISFSAVSFQENKVRYYQYVYYKGYDKARLADAIRDGEAAPTFALFGWDRLLRSLSSAYRPVTDHEIEEEVTRFDEYIKNFNPKNSPETILSYIIVPNNGSVDLSNVDRWYERGEGKIFETFTLHPVQLRNQ